MAKSLASKIAKLEGKKKQVSIGNIREVLARLEDIIAGECARFAGKYPGGESVYFEDSRTLHQLGRNAEKKAMKLIKSKAKKNGSQKVRR